jgi:hypothetical protein
MSRYHCAHCTIDITVAGAADTGGDCPACHEMLCRVCAGGWCSSRPSPEWHDRQRRAREEQLERIATPLRQALREAIEAAGGPIAMTHRDGHQVTIIVDPEGYLLVEGPQPHPALEDLPKDVVMRAMAVRGAHTALRQVDAR